MRWSGLALLSACKFSTSITGDGVVDAAIDAAIDATPDVFDDMCYGRGSLYFCLTTPPNMTEDLDNNPQFNTDNCNVVNSSKIMIGGQQVCVIAAHTVALSAGSTTEVSGSLPLVVVAKTSITIDGTIDASSFDTKRGPGASLTPCSAVVDGVANVGGGGGGAGGTFGSIGGLGGTGLNSATAGGMPTPVAPKPTTLSAGCRGGTGMAGNAANAPGGIGGGVIFFASQGTLTINGLIDASGAGADAGQAAKGGGGGGGSGGLIVFDALGQLTIGASARISANGGGGGGGAGNLDDGDPGADPAGAMPLVPALGGQASTTGRSPGGNGAAAATAATAGTNGANGGGGGGGGVGWIRVLRGPLPSTGTVSPAPVN